MLRRKLASPHIWLWVAGITVFISLILGGVVWYLNRKWKPILDTQLKQLVLEASDSLYRIEYSSFKLNLASGNATIKDFKLIPDEAVYQKLVRERKAPDNLYDLKVENVIIKSFHPKRLYSEKKLNINTILIDNPTLLIVNRRQSYNDTVPETRPKTLYQVISKVFKEVRVNEIKLRDIDFTFDNKSNKPFKKTSLKNLNVSATDLFIDSLSEADRNRFYHTKAVAVSIKDYKIATPDSLYYLTFKNLAFSTLNRRLVIDNVSLQPRYSKLAFYKQVGYAKDRFDIDFNRVAINHVDLRRFTREQKLYAGSLDLNKVQVDIYNNTAYIRIRKNKTGKFPHQQLQKLAFDLKIDTLNIRNALISYSEYNPASKQTGKITFNHTYGRMYNVTNDAAALKKNHFMRAALSSRFMNSGKLDIDFNFNLTSRTGAFTYSGSLRDMNGTALNNITRPLGLIEVKSARINNLYFNVKANNSIARGTMQFYYKDLSVNILKREDQGGLKKQGLVSTVANILVIHENNPNVKGKFTPGTIYYQRASYESFFSYLWKSLFTGVKESVGVSSERESKIRNTVEKVGNFIDKIKDKLADRKQDRQEKREERQQKKEIKKKEKAVKEKTEAVKKEEKKQLKQEKDSL